MSDQDQQNTTELLNMFSYMMDALRKADKTQTLEHFLANLDLGE